MINKPSVERGSFEFVEGTHTFKVTWALDSKQRLWVDGGEENPTKLRMVLPYCATDIGHTDEFVWKIKELLSPLLGI